MSCFDDVVEFHSHHKIPLPSEPVMLSPDDSTYRVGFLLEEVTELASALEQGDIVEAADAIADIVYVALGTAALMGLPFDKIWQFVHDANINGKMLTPTPEASKRGHAFDVIKKEGFEPPQVAIEEYLAHNVVRNVP